MPSLQLFCPVLHYWVAHCTRVLDFSLTFKYFLHSNGTFFFFFKVMLKSRCLFSSPPHPARSAAAPHTACWAAAGSAPRCAAGHPPSPGGWGAPASAPEEHKTAGVRRGVRSRGDRQRFERRRAASLSLLQNYHPVVQTLCRVGQKPQYAKLEFDTWHSDAWLGCRRLLTSAQRVQTTSELLRLIKQGRHWPLLHVLAHGLQIIRNYGASWSPSTVYHKHATSCVMLQTCENPHAGARNSMQTDQNFSIIPICCCE